MSDNPSRDLPAIDHDIEIERALLIYEKRNGRNTDGTCATWRHIDSLLEERMVVQSLPHRAPRPLDGDMVR